MNHLKPLVLVILDGWGYQESPSHNAISQAHTPQWDQWWQQQPHILLEASAENVGLPSGQMGNSEVGHMHMGAGRVVYQDLSRINFEIKQHTLQNHPLLHQCVDQLNQSQRTLHIGGLLSAGGVHSHEEHLFALIDILAPLLKGSLLLHCFLDGRDTPPQNAHQCFNRLQACIERWPNVEIATICGRYYAMDRDNRWERTETAYNLLTQGLSSHTFSSPQQALEHFYSKGILDEFIPATCIEKAMPMKSGDAFLFFNFRADRARQLTEALTAPDFTSFKRQYWPKLSSVITMTRYREDLATESLFLPQSLGNTLGEVIAKHQLSQLRIAETEKYAHVTFFFNGGQESIFAHEDRILIPSPKVATYDLEPDMSAHELTDTLINAMQSQPYDLIICNYANADMVGHTGNFKATVKAIECLDNCLAKLAPAVLQAGGCLLITSDHGNAECMYNENSQQAHTAHTSEPVPLLFVGDGWRFNMQQGSLIDIAPTILKIMNLPKPDEMTGRALMVPL